MHCIRLARAHTGRTKLLKFEGNFHGYHDQVMFSIGTPADQLGRDQRAGRPAGFDRHSRQRRRATRHRAVQSARSARAGDAIARRRAGGRDLRAGLLQRRLHAADGGVSRSPGAAHAQARRAADLRRSAQSRFAWGPAGRRNISASRPTCVRWARPSAAASRFSVFGGRADIMERLMPQGDCQHSGTYNGHPVVVAAGLAAVTAYRQPGFYDHIHRCRRAAVRGLERDLRAARRRGPRAGAGGSVRHLLRRHRRGPRLSRRGAARPRR